MTGFRGNYTVMVTPLSDDGSSVDEGRVRRFVDWQIDQGVHGLIPLGSTGEFLSLTDEERTTIASVVIDQAAGRVPVLVGTAAEWTDECVRYTKEAEQLGADGVMIVPPYYSSPTADELFEHYRRVGEAVSIPIMIYNNPFTSNVDLKPHIVARLSEIDNVSYIKEETRAAGRAATRTMELAGDACEGIMGGASCLYIISEFKRGECGNMPGSQWGDVVSVVWNKLEAGDEAGAREMHTRLLPLLNFELMSGLAAFKEVLVRRGVIATNMTRSPGRKELDRHDMEELTALMAGIDDLLTWSPS